MRGNQQYHPHRIVGLRSIPRVRGNHHASHVPGQGGRSIPASAGQPWTPATSPLRGTVYPRECGATGFWDFWESFFLGLSPRVRGQPSSRWRRPRQPRVYPRECGATPHRVRPDPRLTGLSPRVRGNLFHVGTLPPGAGSIPASAGQPPSLSLQSSRAGVYPRECGATSTARCWGESATGLSPRVRGNRNRQLNCSVSFGSIPASAGQPRSSVPTRRRSRVYPRECGATIAFHFA